MAGTIIFTQQDEMYRRIASIERQMPKRPTLPIRDKALANIKSLNEHRAWVADVWDDLPDEAKVRLSHVAYDIVELREPKKTKSLIERIKFFIWAIQYIREYSQDPTVLETSVELVRTLESFADLILTRIERDNPQYIEDLESAINAGRASQQHGTSLPIDDLDEYFAQLLDD